MALRRHFLWPPLKRASLRAFFTGLCLLTSSATVYAGCLPGLAAETAKVEYVHDGDTVTLANGRKLRFIGVDTPEMGDDQKPAEPLAVEARDYVRKLLERHNHKIKLLYDEEPADRYRRRLAHVFLPDDRSLAEILLQNGLATALVVPPNTRYTACYAAAEKTARDKRKGLWVLPRYQPITVGRLLPETTGFRIVRGEVRRVTRGQRADYIYVGQPGSDKILRVKIAKEDRPLFDATFLNALAGRTVEIRSRIYHEKGRFFARIRHATALQILNP